MSFDLRRAHAAYLGALSIKPRLTTVSPPVRQPRISTAGTLVAIDNAATRCDDLPGYDPALYYPGTCTLLPPAAPVVPTAAAPPAAPAEPAPTPLWRWVVGGGLVAAAIGLTVLIRTR